jgi:LysR family transcriptional activator of glutamate synthase operon
VDPRQLLYFLTTARSEHMGNAAAELRISESTLSRSIARLERQHGVTLFDRIGRGVRLNAYGRVLMGSVEAAFSSLETGEREIRAMARSGSGRVALGFTVSLGPQVVPGLLQRFIARYPDDPPQFRLVEAPAITLRTQLLDGELELTLGTRRFEDAAVDWQPLWDEGLVAVLHPSHRAAGKRVAEFADIAGDRILSFSASETTREAFAVAARVTGSPPNVVFSCDDIATLTGLVAAGFGTAVVPENLWAGEAGVVRVPLHAAPRRTIGIAHAKSRRLSEAAARFRRVIVNDAKALPHTAT